MLYVKIILPLTYLNFLICDVKSESASIAGLFKS